MDKCIFCKIVSGEIPSTSIFENEEVKVIMDIGPVIKGHALVMPKRHYDPVTETPDSVLFELYRVAKQVARAQMNGLGADGVNIVQNNGKAAGQEVSHIHVHVIPRFVGDGHHWNWKAKKYDDVEEMMELAGKLRDHI